MNNRTGSEQHSTRLRVITEQHQRGRNYAKRAARMLDMSPDAVRQFAQRNGIARRRRCQS
jgi:hypothetical protein